MKVRIDGSVCEGHMACVQLCPEIFLVDKDGYSYTDPEAEVPAELWEIVRQAAKSCPVAAIQVTEGE